MSEHDELWGAISDMYKDIYGVRPRIYDFPNMSVTELMKVYKSLLPELERANTERVSQEEWAIQEFEHQVKDTITNGASDRITAIQWLMDAEGEDISPKYFCFCNDLPYDYFDKTG